MRPTPVLAIAVLLTLASPARAELIGEGVNTVRCTERSDPSGIVLPKRMEFLQTISSSTFETNGKVALGVDVDYNDESARGGKIIVVAYQVAVDGAETKLAKIVARLRNGAVEKLKIVDALIPPGERILWRVRLKGVPGLAMHDEACWELGLFVVVADEIPD